MLTYECINDIHTFLSCVQDQNAFTRFTINGHIMHNYGSPCGVFLQVSFNDSILCGYMITSMTRMLVQAVYGIKMLFQDS